MDRAEIRANHRAIRLQVQKFKFRNIFSYFFIWEFICRNTTEVMWSIDEWARIIFPLLFSAMQTAYWVTYLHLYETHPDDDD